MDNHRRCGEQPGEARPRCPFEADAAARVTVRLSTDSDEQRAPDDFAKPALGRRFLSAAFARRGGGEHERNVQALCAVCNLSKGER
jgi:5-methylcytosine-specific restriction endonuclease McrA